MEGDFVKATGLEKDLYSLVPECVQNWYVPFFIPAFNCYIYLKA